MQIRDGNAEQNVLVSGREPRADDDDDEEDLQENEEDLRVKEEKRLKELTCDPELDELENEVAELTEKVGEQRLTGPRECCKTWRID